MIYHLFEYLTRQGIALPFSRLFTYVSFRVGLALIVALLISTIWGSKVIDFLRRKQIGELVRDLGLEGEQTKKGTPTMGGVIIIMAILVPTLLFARLDNIYVILMIVTTLLMGFWVLLMTISRYSRRIRMGSRSTTRSSGRSSSASSSV